MRRGLGIMIILVVFGICRPVFADWQVCNDRAPAMWVALGWRKAPGGITTKGWFRVQGCGCRQLLTGQPLGNEVYVYAKREDDGTPLVDVKQYLLCMDVTNAFEMFNPDSLQSSTICAVSAKHAAGVFWAFPLNPNGVTTTHVKLPKKDGDNVCID